MIQFFYFYVTVKAKMVHHRETFVRVIVLSMVDSFQDSLKMAQSAERTIYMSVYP